MTENVIVKLVSPPSHVRGAVSVIRTVWNSVGLVESTTAEDMYLRIFLRDFGM